MVKKQEGTVIPPPEGSWLKPGEEIRVSGGSSHIMGHDIVGPTLEAALQEEVRNLLLSEDTVSPVISTCVLYDNKKYHLEIQICREDISAGYSKID